MLSLPATVHGHAVIGVGVRGVSLTELVLIHNYCDFFIFFQLTMQWDENEVSSALKDKQLLSTVLSDLSVLPRQS